MYRTNLPLTDFCTVVLRSTLHTREATEELIAVTLSGSFINLIFLPSRPGPPLVLLQHQITMKTVLASRTIDIPDGGKTPICSCSGIGCNA